MKSITKKITGIGLSAMLGVSMLAGCGGKPASASTAVSGSASAASGSTEVQTIRVLGPETSNNQFFHMADRDQYEVWHVFEEEALKRGLKFEFELVPADQYEVIVQTRMAAANDLPDLVAIGPLDTPTAVNLGEKGIIQPLNDIIEQYSDGTAKNFYATGGPGDFSRKLNTTPDGKMYWFTSTQRATYEGVPRAATMTQIIRKDWIEKLGLELPKTTDDYFNVMKAFRDQDANGNGLKDEILVFPSTEVFCSGISQWYGLVSGLAGIDFAANKVTSPWYQEGAKAYFEYLNRLYKKGILDLSAVEDQTNAANAMASRYSYATQSWLESATGDANAAYIALDTLQAVDGITPLYAQTPPSYSYPNNKFAFTKEMKDPAVIAKVLDLLTSEFYRDLTEWGVEGVTYEKKDGVNINLMAGKSMEELYNAKLAKGFFVWGLGVFPRMNWAGDFGVELGPNSKLQEYKKESQINILKNLNDKNTSTTDSASFYAMPTAEQTEKIGTIYTDLKTYSEELATKLIIGEASVDQWDTYVAELKSLGLDDLIAIYQEQYDRYRNG